MTKAEIIQWIKDYKRPIDDVSEFAKQLGEKIKTMDFTSSNNGAGSLDGSNARYTGLYITVGGISEYSGNAYSYINYSAENNIDRQVNMINIRDITMKMY